MNEPEIDRSRAQCMKCFDIIESHYRHDFVRCKCGNICLDSGVGYVRYGGPTLNKEHINLLTEYRQGPQKGVNPRLDEEQSEFIHKGSSA